MEVVRNGFDENVNSLLLQISRANPRSGFSLFAMKNLYAEFMEWGNIHFN